MKVQVTYVFPKGHQFNPNQLANGIPPGYTVVMGPPPGAQLWRPDMPFPPAPVGPVLLPRPGMPAPVGATGQLPPFPGGAGGNPMISLVKVEGPQTTSTLPSTDEAKPKASTTHLTLPSLNAIGETTKMEVGEDGEPIEQKPIAVAPEPPTTAVAPPRPAGAGAAPAGAPVRAPIFNMFPPLPFPFGMAMKPVGFTAGPLQQNFPPPPPPMQDTKQEAKANVKAEEEMEVDSEEKEIELQAEGMAAYIRHKIRNVKPDPKGDLDGKWWLCPLRDCEKSYKQYDGLFRHFRVHTPWAFECQYCHHRFPRKQDKEEHERTHTGEKPFRCDICQMGFKQRQNMRTHRKTHPAELIAAADAKQAKIKAAQAARALGLRRRSRSYSAH